MKSSLLLIIRAKVFLFQVFMRFKNTHPIEVLQKNFEFICACVCAHVLVYVSILQHECIYVCVL